MEETYYNMEINKASLKAISRRKYAVKILKFLSENDDEAFYLSELAKQLNICDVVVRQNMDKLEAAGLVRRTQGNPIQRNIVYYEVKNKDAAMYVIEKFRRYVGFQLARHVTERKTEQQLRKDIEVDCKRFKISVDEGIQCLNLCPSIAKERQYDTTIYYRKP
ncbi:MAG: winged helix-turn-helix domain-containing protein [Candidatus Bathyarchaeia archaeon]